MGLFMRDQMNDHVPHSVHSCARKTAGRGAKRERYSHIFLFFAELSAHVQEMM